MDLNELLRLDRIHGARPDASPPAAATDDGFAKLLDELRRSTPEGSAPPALEGFADALRAADDDFAALMDLRRQLEDAYRRRQP